MRYVTAKYIVGIKDALDEVEKADCRVRSFPDNPYGHRDALYNLEAASRILGAMYEALLSTSTSVIDQITLGTAIVPADGHIDDMPADEIEEFERARYGIVCE